MSNFVRYGSVSSGEWQRLLAAGWRGRAGDGMEALYAPPSRQVIRAARRVADQQTARLANVPSVRMLRATVASVAPGGAGDGNAKVWVTWRGEVLEATYGAHYTPVVGHRVLCVIVDNQLEIVQRTVGATPTAS